MNCVNLGEIKRIIKGALKEDIGRKDITTLSIVNENKVVNAFLLAKEDFTVCGLGIAKEAFKALDKKINFIPLVKEGRLIKRGEVVARIRGKAQGILAAERVALNFLCLLSGIATETKKYVSKIKPYKVRILDTRKTIPGLRSLEKYAVRIGGGYNHRFNLEEMFLIKDNHFLIIKGMRQALSLREIIKKMRKGSKKNIKLEIEVKNLKEFNEALKACPDIIMLDNMKIADIKKAVKIKHNAQIEASGGITLQNVKKIASCGVDMISVGSLTHSVNSVDISLEIEAC